MARSWSKGRCTGRCDHRSGQERHDQKGKIVSDQVGAACHILLPHFGHSTCSGCCSGPVALVRQAITPYRDDVGTLAYSVYPIAEMAGHRDNQRRSI